MASTQRSRMMGNPNPGTANSLTILGYLNFSGGEPNADFRRELNLASQEMQDYWEAPRIKQWLESALADARENAAGFAESTQASRVIELVFGHVLPAYRVHHADLLFHLEPSEFCRPFFLACLFEAVLQQGSPWEETERITTGAVNDLNDFLGYRPLAVLENGRQMQPYSHERFRPVPVYFQNVGAAYGPYQALIERTIQFFEETPTEIQRQSYFDLNNLKELAVDVRAHDHLHPVNKRTNYMFGEWDPHLVDTKGFYNRFVIRRIILDALLNWMSENRKGRGRLSEEEILFDASAVLCGTMLMASSISGSGPGIHDSTITLTSLLPRVAHQRDAFYARLLQEATGKRAERLHKEAELTQQPFGHVRQRLNIELAKYGAKQVQTRHLAQMYARMGYSAASRKQALVIPSASARFECEIEWRMTDAHRQIEHGNLENAVTRTREIEDFLKRGIDCGAIIDPWNILGFQGQFPLFTSREDSLHDLRAIDLIEMMERIFRVYSQTLGEAAAQGKQAVLDDLTSRFEQMAAWWDRFATTTVEDMPEVSGQDSVESARHVAETLREWLKAGAAAGDISFWKTQIDRFQSAKAYALVVDALLERGDQVASMALLMQWLNQAEFVGLDSGPYSIYSRLVKWMQVVLSAPETQSPQEVEELQRTVTRMFAYLEANAGEFWEVPTLSAALGVADSPKEEAADLTDTGLPDDEDDEDDLFAAAYDDVVFRDSADDGQESDIADEGGHLDDASFELMARFLEPRLQLLETVAELWQMSASGLAPHLTSRIGTETHAVTESQANFQSQVESWLAQARRWRTGLRDLRKALWTRSITLPSGDHDSNVEYDEQLQTKYYLLHAAISTDIHCEAAERSLQSCLDVDSTKKTAVPAVVEIYRGVLTQNAAMVKRRLPELIEDLINRPLLYVPLNNNGDPEPVRDAQSLQSLIRFLLTQLPRLGLLRETWILLKTAYRMERRSRPGGQAVTEFDQLFRTALRHSLECVIRSSRKWRLESAQKFGPIRRSRARQSDRYSENDRRIQSRYSPAGYHTNIVPRSNTRRDRNSLLIKMVSEIVKRYSGLWVKHSGTTRLSTVENLSDRTLWKEIKQFIIKYGAELFHARMLTLGNLRAILHNGIDRFLEYLDEHDDPLHPLPLLEEMRSGDVDPEQVVEYLELIYGSVVDRMDRFVEYNTTTTQSDYGERFYCFLDFLRAEAAYERDAWNLMPFSIAHEELSLCGQHEAALLWEAVFRAKNRKRANEHLKRLKRLEKEHGMHLPALTDRIEERFVKPFAVNRMVAMIPQAVEDARHGTLASPTFTTLEHEIQDYLDTTSGSGIDVAPWLRTLEKEIEQAAEQSDAGTSTGDQAGLPIAVPVSLRAMQRQLRQWSRETNRKRTNS